MLDWIIVDTLGIMPFILYYVTNLILSFFINKLHAEHSKWPSSCISFMLSTDRDQALADLNYLCYYCTYIWWYSIVNLYFICLQRERERANDFKSSSCRVKCYYLGMGQVSFFIYFSHMQASTFVRSVWWKDQASKSNICLHLRDCSS